MKFIFIFLLYLLFTASIRPRQYLSTKRIESDLIIDGIMNESSWIDADSISNFIQVEPDFGKLAGYKTVVRILYNSEYLYIGGTCYNKDKEESVRVSDLKRDFIFEESDGFGVILDLLNDKRNATAFFINPLGAQRDLMVFDEKIIDENWNTKWYSAAYVNSYGWTFEIAIPWTSLRYSNGAESIGANFVRLERKSNELSAWIPYPRTYTMFRLNYTGVLRGLKLPESHQDIRLTPYMLVQNNTQKNFPVYGNKKIKPGAEAKWAINSNTLLDLTLNTDFAQADADRDVINLSRFDISLPERRQFFLESAGLFKAGDAEGIIEPFSSRRIGLDDSGNPIPMDGGARLVHRGLKENYGLLTAHAHIPDSINSFFLVGRYSKNYGEQNRLGFLATFRKDDFKNGNNKNIVAAADGFIRPNTALSFNWMLSGSGNLLSEGEKYYGYSGAITFTFLTEDINLFFRNYLISKNYFPGSGFAAAKNIAELETGTDLFLRPRWVPDFIRDFEPGFYISYYRNLDDGRLRQFYLTIWPIYILFQNGSVISAHWLPTWENLYEEFSPAEDVVYARGKYFYNRYELKAASDPSAVFYCSLLLSAGGYYNGRLSKLSSQIKFTPIPNISASIGYEPNWLSGEGASRSYKKIEIIRTELDLSLNPRIGLTGIYQYNSENKSSLTNIRFAWEYSPLSYLYILYNIGKFGGINYRNIDRYRLMLKLSYQFQL